MFVEAIITAIIVSIDGFFSGFAVGIKKTKIILNKLFIIGTIPIIMAIPIMLLGNYVSSLITSKACNYIGFILFIFLAISSFIQIRKNKNNDEIEYNNINLANSIIVGFTIGIDSSISAFSLALHNHNPFITPFYFGIAHGILIWFGNFLALRKNIANIHLIEYLSPLLFTIIAITKII